MFWAVLNSPTNHRLTRTFKISLKSCRKWYTMINKKVHVEYYYSLFALPIANCACSRILIFIILFTKTSTNNKVYIRITSTNSLYDIGIILVHCIHWYTRQVKPSSWDKYTNVCMVCGAWMVSFIQFSIEKLSAVWLRQRLQYFCFLFEERCFRLNLFLLVTSKYW